MEEDRILPRRDLIKDQLGNYYFVRSISENEMILVNAVVLYASNRIVNDEFLKKHKGEIVTHFATQMLKDRIEQLQNEIIPGKIYLLESLVGTYDVVVDSFYDRSPN